MFNVPRLVFNNFIPDNKLQIINAQGLQFTYEFISKYIGEIYIVNKYWHKVR